MARPRGFADVGGPMATDAAIEKIGGVMVNGGIASPDMDVVGVAPRRYLAAHLAAAARPGFD